MTRWITAPLVLLGLGIFAHGALWLFAPEPWLLDQAANETLLHSTYAELLAADANHHLPAYLTGLYRFFGWWLVVIGLLIFGFIRAADLRQRRARVTLQGVLLVAIVGALILQVRFIPSSPYLFTTALMFVAWAVSVGAGLRLSDVRDEGQVWDELAGSYDRALRFLDGPYDEVRRRLAEDLRGSSRVLEVAAGTGLFTGAIASAASEVVSTDLSPQMLGALRARVESEGLGNVACEEADVTELPYADASFDAVVCANVLHVMPSPERALAEMKRVLAPGGLILAPTFAHGARPRARLVSRVLSWVSPFRSYSRFDADSLERLVRAAGFSSVAVVQVEGILPIVHLRGVLDPAAVP